MAAAVAVPLIWYAVFEWNSFDYPNYDKRPCYSPNHAYYVTRHQTLPEALHLFTPHDLGTARLFDRSGKLLYEEETNVSGEFGPMWSSGTDNDATDRPQVFYQGNEESDWKFTLPDSPGKGNPNQHCYPTRVE